MNLPQKGTEGTKERRNARAQRGRSTTKEDSRWRMAGHRGSRMPVGKNDARPIAVPCFRREDAGQHTDLGKHRIKWPAAENADARRLATLSRQSATE